jgi:hypothetical protein
MSDKLRHAFSPWARPVHQRPSLAARLCQLARRNALVWLPLALAPVAIAGPPAATALTTDWGWTLAIRHHAARASCDSARLMGLAPAAEGQPGYWPHLDGNDDGWSCTASSRRTRR